MWSKMTPLRWLWLRSDRMVSFVVMRGTYENSGFEVWDSLMQVEATIDRVGTTFMARRDLQLVGRETVMHLTILFPFTDGAIVICESSSTAFVSWLTEPPRGVCAYTSFVSLNMCTCAPLFQYVQHFQYTSARIPCDGPLFLSHKLRNFTVDLIASQAFVVFSHWIFTFKAAPHFSKIRLCSILDVHVPVFRDGSVLLGFV